MTKVPRTYRLEPEIVRAIEAKEKLTGDNKNAIVERSLRVELADLIERVPNRAQEPDADGAGGSRAPAGAVSARPAETPVIEAPAMPPAGEHARGKAVRLGSHQVDLARAEVDHEAAARELAEADGISLVAARLIVRQRDG